MAAVLIVLVAMVLTGCQVDADVAVGFNDDGSGTVRVDVRVDKEAAKALGEPSGAVKLDDLRAAGWKVTNPVEDKKTGGFVITGTRQFRSIDELSEILSDVGRNPDASKAGAVPFISHVELTAADGFARTGYAFKAQLTIAGGLAQFSDTDLTAALGGLPIGRTPEELAGLGYVAGAGIGTMTVRVRPPGTIQSHNGRLVGEYVEWSAPIGADQVITKDLSIKTVSAQQGPRILGIAGGVGIIASIVLVTVGLIRRRAR